MVAAAASDGDLRRRVAGAVIEESRRSQAPDLWLFEATAHYRAGKYTKACKTFARVCRVDASLLGGKSLIDWARSASACGEFGRAVDLFCRGFDAAPSLLRGAASEDFVRAVHGEGLAVELRLLSIACENLSHAQAVSLLSQAFLQNRNDCQYAVLCRQDGRVEKVSDISAFTPEVASSCPQILRQAKARSGVQVVRLLRKKAALLAFVVPVGELMLVVHPAAVAESVPQEKALVQLGRDGLSAPKRQDLWQRFFQPVRNTQGRRLSRALADAFAATHHRLWQQRAKALRRILQGYSAFAYLAVEPRAGGAKAVAIASKAVPANAIPKDPSAKDVAFGAVRIRTIRDLRVREQLILIRAGAPVQEALLRLGVVLTQTGHASGPLHTKEKLP